MTDWTWESPQLWAALIVTALGCGAWVLVTWLKGRHQHRWTPFGEMTTVSAWSHRQQEFVPVKYEQACRCSECGEIRRFRV